MELGELRPVLQARHAGWVAETSRPNEALGVVAEDDLGASSLITNGWGSQWPKGGFFPISNGRYRIDSHIWVVAKVTRPPSDV